MKTVLVAGVNGFVGRHLAHELRNQGLRVIGAGLDHEIDPSLTNIVDEYIGSCDLTNEQDIRNIPFSRISSIINLAGLAQVGASFKNPEKYEHINVAVHSTLAGFLLELGTPPVRIVAISTGAVYDPHQPMPLHEESRLVDRETGSPYALSKIAMERAMEKFVASGLDIVIARPFNHIGPGQLNGFIVPDLTSQVIESDAIKVGDLTTKRDYTDVRDVVKAYAKLAMLSSPKHRVYNICSGNSTSGEKLLEIILRKLDRTNAKINRDSSKIRPNDPKEIIGDNSRLSSETGWQPTIPLEKTIEDYIRSL